MVRNGAEKEDVLLMSCLTDDWSCFLIKQGIFTMQILYVLNRENHEK